MKKSLFILSFLILFVNCNRKNKSSITGIEQELIYITQELQNKNYENIINFIDNYFKKNQLNENNAELLYKKSEILSEMAKESKKIKDLKKYGFQLKNNKIYYDYKELKEIWETLPDSEIGKKAFDKYFENLNSKEKIDALENYISKTKNYKIENLFRLADYYISSSSNNIPINKLYSIYNEVYKIAEDGYYKNLAFLNKTILEINQKKELEEIIKELENLKLKDSYLNLIQYYILGELYFKIEQFEKSISYFNKALKIIDKSKNYKIPNLLVSIVEFPDNSIENLKSQIEKIKDLINLTVSYNNQLKSNRIGIIVGKRVRVRKEPVMKKNNIVNSLNFGEKVIILLKKSEPENIEGATDYWYKIQMKDGTVGWIFGKYIVKSL